MRSPFGKSASPNFGANSHWDSGDIMFFVIEEEGCRCSNLPLLFIYKEHDLKGHGMSYY